MLMYVIPLVILIIVLIVIKKRQGANAGSSQSSKKTLNKKIKKLSSSSSAQSTQVVDNSIIEKKETTPLPTELRTSIETQIRDHNFFAAEAQINQSLKKDNSLHGLYLLLLDVHLLQKDEFAIDQLLAHIRSLELNEIQIEAEAKINQYKQENNKEFESIAFTPKAKDINAATPSHISDDVNHEFDALFKKSVQGNLPPATDFTKNVLPEPDLQSETVEEYIPQIKETAAEIEPLEFNFSFDQTKVETQVAEPLDQKIETEIIETPPNIDFNTSDIALAPIEPILDNSLSAQSDIANEVELPPIELALEQPRIIETAPESLSLLSLDTALDVSSAPLDFSHESNDISVDQIRDSISQYDLNDPIIQAFPEVAQLNEINLNFELATQYIELGAYDAARAIIAEQESQYNNEQRHFANQLLNKIET